MYAATSAVSYKIVFPRTFWVLPIHPSPHPDTYHKPLATTDLTVAFFLEYHVVKIMQYVNFSDWFLPSLNPPLTAT